MDLVGRKLPMNGGRALQAFLKIVGEEVAQAKGDEKLAGFAEALEKASGQLGAATMWLMQNAMKNPDNAGAGAVHYMHILGIVATGLMWLRMAKAATALLAAGQGDAKFLEAKLVTARFFAERIRSEERRVGKESVRTCRSRGT